MPEGKKKENVERNVNKLNLHAGLKFIHFYKFCLMEHHSNFQNLTFKKEVESP